VGRDTLIAVAIDGAGQTTSVVRPVTVRRFTPDALRLSVTPSRDRTPFYRFRASGRLPRPGPVSPSQGCTGEVTINIRAGSRLVSARHVRLSRTCEYALTVRFRTRVASRLRFSATFGGNETLAPRAASSRTVRLG
jgi:hypothetical protein